MTISETSERGEDTLSETLNRLNRLSGYAGVASKIIMAILIIVIIGAVVAIAAVALDNSMIIEEMAKEAVTKGDVQAAALNAIAAACAGLAIMYYVNRLFTNIHKNNALFTDDNVRDLRTIALLLVAAAIVITTVGVLTIVFLLDTTDIVVGFNPLSMLLTAFIVYIVSLIFSHGTELQKQSDETL